MTRLVLSILAASLTAGLLPATAIAQPAPAPPPLLSGKPAALIRGRITSADNGRPLRRASVLLRAEGQARAILTVSTNSQGAFELRDVPPGRYLVSATRAGYLELQHGQRRPRERGLPIEVRSGDTRERVDIALPRGSVITGRVVDELGAPYPGVTLIALEARFQSGARVYAPAGGGATDDVGQYRISGLPPGRYFLLATSPETWRNERKETFGYAATFFPGAHAVEQAQGITVGIGEERINSDLLMIASRTGRIRGRVLRPTGEPLGGEPVAMSRSIGNGAVLAGGGAQTRTAPDGSFEFRDVAPASYDVRASSSGASASTLITMTGADIDNVVLVPRTGSTLLARVVAEDGQPPPFPASGVRVNLVPPPAARVLPTVRVPGVDNDWTVRMTSVGGPFVFRLVGLPDEWMLQSVTVGERDITDAPWDVPATGAEIADMQFVITRSVGSVTGSVTSADGKPTPDATVVLFAEDPALWTVASRFVRSTRPGADGRFAITGLPAGTYLAVVREFVADGEWESREFLDAARESALRVTLANGGSALLELRTKN